MGGLVFLLLSLLSTVVGMSGISFEWSALVGWVISVCGVFLLPGIASGITETLASYLNLSKARVPDDNGWK